MSGCRPEATFTIGESGKVRLDLTAATWDAREIDLRLRTNTGKIEVIIPKGRDVTARTIAVFE